MSPQPHHAADNNNDAKKVSDMINIRSSNIVSLIRFLRITDSTKILAFF